jgi:hypothetical protein
MSTTDDIVMTTIPNEQASEATIVVLATASSTALARPVQYTEILTLTIDELIAQRNLYLNIHAIIPENQLTTHPPYATLCQWLKVGSRLSWQSPNW